MDERRVNPMRLTLDEAAKLLSGAGGRSVTPEMLEEDVAEGAPTNGDGTLNLVDYTAWLAREATGRGD